MGQPNRWNHVSGQHPRMILAQVSTGECARLPQRARSWPHRARAWDEAYPFGGASPATLNSTRW
jgi:hypothetical protein